MILGEPFEAFVKAAPVSVMMRAIIENTFDSQRIDAIFSQTAESQYTRLLPFSTVADLLSEVVFSISPSVGAAQRANAEAISVSRKSVYNKLNGVEPNVSAALVHDTVARLAPVIDAPDALPPPLLEGYRIRILDGNPFDATQHRFHELRQVADAPLPGKALVVLDPQRMLATYVVPFSDGHAQERALLDQILPLVREGELWIGDRNESTMPFLFGIAERGGQFLLRQHGNLKGCLLGERQLMGDTETVGCTNNVSV
jgi:hypothetical protein